MKMHAKVTASKSGGKHGGKKVREIRVVPAQNGASVHTEYHPSEEEMKGPYMGSSSEPPMVFSGPGHEEQTADHVCQQLGGGSMLAKGKGKAAPATPGKKAEKGKV